MKKIRHACVVAVIGVTAMVFGAVATAVPAQACQWQNRTASVPAQRS